MNPSDPPPPSEPPPPFDPTDAATPAPPAPPARVKVVRRGQYRELADDARPTEPDAPVHGRRDAGR